MERGVQVKRCKRTGNFLFNPVGTFRGYGAYVGINPYREAAVDATDDALGQMVSDLLGLSGPTGVPFAEATRYLVDSRDEETTRIRHQYQLERAGLTTSKLAQRFLHAEVYVRHGQKSWCIQVYKYNSQRRTMSGEGQPIVRVRHSGGARVLGATLRAALKLARRRRNKDST